MPIPISFVVATHPTKCVRIAPLKQLVGLSIPRLAIDVYINIDKAEELRL